MGWLEEQNNKFVLSKGGTGIEIVSRGDNWTDVHIRSAYQKGVVRARQELRKAGVDLPSFESQPSGISGVFNAPFHADRAQLAFTQTFEGLKGITKAMDAPISRVMAEGMARGDSPRIIAKSIAGIGGEIDKIGLNRARTLARTEVIRAHHNANINEYEAAGIDKVKVKAEWSTAGFNVCPICESNEGRIFTLNQIRGLIPVHPNCRCVAIPIVESDKRFKRKTSKVATSIVKGDVQFENI
jgi:SPP1 gp7 family putative phage head morphogenesis protein